MTTAADAKLLAVFLQDANRVQTSLVAMLDELQKHIVGQEPGNIESCLVESATILDNMEALEKNRAKIFAHLERVCGIKLRVDGMEEMILRMPEDERQVLSDLRMALTKSSKDLKRCSMRCGVLARHALTFNEGLVRALFAVGEAATVYTADGSTSRGAEMILDRSI